MRCCLCCSIASWVVSAVQAKLVRAAADDVLLQWKARYPGTCIAPYHGSMYLLHSATRRPSTPRSDAVAKSECAGAAC